MTRVTFHAFSLRRLGLIVITGSGGALSLRLVLLFNEHNLLGPKSLAVCLFVCLFVCLIVFFLRAERKGDDIFNCTRFHLPENCTAKYTSPSAEFWT